MMVAARRHGAAAARALKPVAGAFPQTSEPWEEVHLDSTPMDLMIVDETHRKPIGRPTGTFALDLFSRVIPGFALTLEPPSTLTSALCLAHAAQDKAEWLAQRGLDLDWPIWGIPRRLGFDRGGEYDGKGFLRGLQQYGIEASAGRTPPARRDGTGHRHLHAARPRVPRHDLLRRERARAV
jgi:putative transposase